jgi:CRISPR-associated endonuclease/helicase Cas3
MQNELSGLEPEILKSKNFDLMYDQVMEKIDRQNDRIYQQGFSDFQNYLKTLNFPEVNQNFQIINQQNTSVFVPMSLPVFVPGTNQTQRNFSDKEIDFLQKYGIEKQKNDNVSGKAVFELYERLIRQKGDDFIATKTQLKKLQGIISQFVFSLMSHSKSMKKIMEEVHGEERMGMYYLSHWKEDGVYDYKFGLIETDEPAIIL